MVMTPTELHTERSRDNGKVSPGVFTLKKSLDNGEPSISSQSKINLLPKFQMRMRRLNMASE